MNVLRIGYCLFPCSYYHMFFPSFWAYSAIKIFFSFTRTGGKKRQQNRNFIAASLHIGHDGYLRRAVCKMANHNWSDSVAVLLSVT